MPQRLLGDRRDAVPVDVLHREDVHAGESRTATFSRSSRLRIADEDGVLRAHLRRESRRARPAPRLGSEQRRQRHAVDVAALSWRACSCRRARRPTAGRSAGPPARELGGAPPEPARQAVIAAEHERQRAGSSAASACVVELLADRAISRMYFFRRVARRISPPGWAR
jgi:hypothetical protein